MKVFEFDPTNGTKGNLICEIARIDAFSNRELKVAKTPNMKDCNWSVATKLEDRNGKPVTFDRPVCFCIGQLTAGTDTAWEWVAYLPA